MRPLRYCAFSLCLATALSVTGLVTRSMAVPPETVAETRGAADSAPADIVAAIRKAMDQFETPGLSVAVIDGGRLIWAEGFGVCEEGTARPVTSETRFQAASISKPVTAAAVLHLVSRGLLDLDQDVNEKLKTWKLPESAEASHRTVTLRLLLCHGAGTSVHGFRGYAEGEEVPSLTQILDGQPPANSEAVRVVVRPGNVFRYSGGGYTIVQQLLIDVTGTAFPQLMAEAVLDPLEMRCSTYQQPLSVDWRGAAATGHRKGRKPIPGQCFTYPEMAAAGLWTTPSDLARFVLAIQEAVAGKSTRLLPQQLAEEMLAPQVKPIIGLGLMRQGEAAAARFIHGGANEGFRCQLVGYRTTGQGAVVMTNSDLGGPAAAAVIAAIGSHYGWPK